MPSLEQIRKLLEAEPDDTFLNYSLAMELARQNLTDQALAAFDRVLQLDPSYTAAHYHQAKTYIESERYDEARKTLESGLAAAKAAGNTHAHDEMLGLLEMIP